MYNVLMCIDMFLLELIFICLFVTNLMNWQK